MGWLHERGLVSCWQDYLDLPLGVLIDARMIMHHESIARQADLKKQQRPRPRRGGR